MSSGMPAYPKRAIATIQVPSHAFSAVASFSPLPVIRPSTADADEADGDVHPGRGERGERPGGRATTGGRGVAALLVRYDGDGAGGDVRGDVGGALATCAPSWSTVRGSSVRRGATAPGNVTPLRPDASPVT